MSEIKKSWFRDLRTGVRFSLTAADEVRFYLSRGENRAAAIAAKKAATAADPVLRDIVQMLARQVSLSGDTYSGPGNPKQSEQARLRRNAFDLYRALVVAYGLCHGGRFTASELVHTMHWYFRVVPNDVRDEDIDLRLRKMTVIVTADLDGAHSALQEEAKKFLLHYGLSHKKTKTFARLAKDIVVCRTGISADGIAVEIRKFNNRARSNK